MCWVFRRSLRRKGVKFTPERAKILDAVLSKQGMFEAEALLFEMRRTGHRVSKATIYRTLKHLMEANIVSEVLIGSKQLHYRLSFGREATSHLVCVGTNTIIEFSAQQLDELTQRICAEHGFEPLNYKFVVYGISPEARQDESGEKV